MHSMTRRMIPATAWAMPEKLVRLAMATHYEVVVRNRFAISHNYVIFQAT